MKKQKLVRKNLWIWDSQAKKLEKEAKNREITESARLREILGVV